MHHKKLLHCQIWKMLTDHLNVIISGFGVKKTKQVSTYKYIFIQALTPLPRPKTQVIKAREQHDAGNVRREETAQTKTLLIKIIQQKEAGLSDIPGFLKSYV